MRHFFVGSHEEVATIRQGREARWAARQHGKAVALEFEIADDFRTEKAIDVAGGGNLKTRPKLFGDDTAPDEFAAFEDENFSSGAGEISRSYKAVVTRAYNDSVVF